MSLYALGAALITDQVEVILEIARNLAGDVPPAAARPPLPVSGPADAAWGDFPQEGSDFLDEVNAGRRAEPSATSLLGVRPPFPPGASDPAGIQRIVQLLASIGPGATGQGRPAGDEAGAAPGPLDRGVPAGAGSAEVRGQTPAGAPSAPGEGQKVETGASPGASASREGAVQASDPTWTQASVAGVSPSPPASDAAGMQRPTDGAGALPATGAGAVAGVAVQNTAAADALAMLGLAGGAAQLGSLPSDQAGVLASFILNAHMLPGWPPPLPFAALSETFGSARLSIVPQLSRNEEQVLVYLLNLGLNPDHIARILKAIRSVRRRSSLFMAIASILSSTASVTHVIEMELAALVEDLLQEQKLRMRTLPGKRLRTDLR